MKLRGPEPNNSPIIDISSVIEDEEEDESTSFIRRYLNNNED